MKISNVMLHELYDKTNLTLTFPKGAYEELRRLTSGIRAGKEYTLEIKEVHKKRSKDANSYAWVLIGKLATFYKMEPNEIYKEQIRKMPVYEVVCVKKEAAESLISKWAAKGMGWLAEVEDSKLPGCANIRLFYGSSTYNSAQMAMFIDNLIYECDRANISLADREEILKAKEKW